MPRYVAFLRGVSPLNAKMTKLKECFEKAGFTNVKTVLASGNVVFDSRKSSEKSLELRIETAMEKHLDQVFFTIVRSVEYLQAILDSDPFQSFRLRPNAKRVVTFLRVRPQGNIVLPPEQEGSRILKIEGREVYTRYVRNAGGPAFMRLIEKTFGKEVTTRTWETVKKVVR
jgi:uncharacterized protein (DUF1697 family)